MPLPGRSGWTLKSCFKRRMPFYPGTERVKPGSTVGENMVRVGVIGYGYWGPVVARNFQAADGCELAGICDANPTAQDRARKAHPGVSVTGDASEILRSPQIDAVAVITPVWSHFELAKAALENGKHVFVEKP